MNKNKISTVIALILMLTATTLMVGMPVAKATDFQTYAFIAVAPNPVGINQTVNVVVWLDIPPPTAAGPSGDRWQGFLVKITAPDGTTETKGPFTSDDTGGAFFSYTPTQVGKYSFLFSFPGQWINTTTYQRWYKPCMSRVAELTVQQQLLSYTPEIPLPTGYWARPISAENREWYRISGNWLMAKYDKDAVAYEGSGSWNQYTTAPNTAHIVWTKQLAFGGIVGGTYGYGMSYYTGLQYEPKLRPPIIMNGILYYNTADPPIYGFRAVDLRSGEVLWYQNSTYQLSLGQIYVYDSPNQHGAIPYLWSVAGSTWHMFDAFTGNYILTINNVPSGYITYGPSGEVLVYTINGANHWLSMWNSSRAIPPPAGGGSNDWMWRPDNYRGQTLNGTRGIQWNVTIPNNVPAASSIQWYWNDILVSQAIVSMPGVQYPTLVHSAFNAKTGEQLWIQNRTNMGTMTYPVYITPNEGVYALFVRETKQWYAWSVETGSQLWVTEPIEDDWGFYQVCGGFAYGKFYSAGYDGTLHAYDAKTGAHLWDYYCGNAGFDTPYGSWPLFGALIFADGKIYVGNNEHSPSVPLWRGEKLHCIDAETGKGVWNISGMYAGGRNGLGAVADGYLVTTNGYDNCIYCFGKGPSKTSVAASPKISTIGAEVLVEGMVTDESPGAKEYAQTARFPNGVPAIADEDMSAWMEYVYQQQPKPVNARGVEVTITVLDPNGNCYDVAKATSDINGFYSCTFEPPVPGKYTVIATFSGSESYYGSSAETAIFVEEAPPAAPEATPAPQAPVETYFAVSTVAIIVAIAVAVVLLRKRS